ncbi:MAG: CPBP family intramembrane metalloprotease, partial [Lachnospiraceae bacterium]|nr:CPBP family intramembrane metalloprotease [Lachnospiraceae bacterium]
VSELIYAAIAVGAVFVFRASPAKVFPIDPPKVRYFFGSLLLFGFVYSVSISVALVTQYFFPQAAGSTETIVEFAQSVNPAIGILCIALIPAICEEMLFRGFILSSVKKWKPWIAITVTGVLFGAAHLSVYRFLPVALLGCLLAYIDLKTDSLFLGMLFHFFNNLISVVTLYLSPADPSEGVDVISSFSFGVILSTCLIFLSAGIVGGVFGWFILNDKKLTFKTVAVTLACSFAVSFFGTFVAGVSAVADSEIFVKQLDETRTESTSVFTVEEERSYTFLSNTGAVGGSVTVTLVGPDGNEIFRLEKTGMETRSLTLSPGEYTVFFAFTPSEEQTVSGNRFASVTMIVEKL